jgi:RNA polymerase sigma factor (sigma-70 family)
MGFRIAQLADLGRQMQFTPTDLRGRQIASAEELLLQIEPAKSYPYDFVLFRVTGYHAKRTSQDIADETPLSGTDLQHDLGLLIEEVSDSLGQLSEAAEQPVLSIEQVCKQFNVSDKSIQRWRRRGLAARRFVFPDGRNRIGFFVSSVERFFAIYRETAQQTPNFSVVAGDERDQMVQSAQRLAAGGCCVDQIAHRIGRRMSRSPLTIARVLARHDQENPSASVLAAASAPLTADECKAVVQAYRDGQSLAVIAGRFARPRSVIYRSIFEHRLERLGNLRVRFIDDPLYHQPEAADVVAAIVAADALPPEQRDADQRIPKNLPAYLQTLYRRPLLTAPQERALFLKFNFHRFQFETLRRELQATRIRWRDLDRLESHLQHAIDTRNQIVAANLRLVVSVARKHLPSAQSAWRIGASLMEMVSDGNLALMRAADGFDIHRGNRFSSYATFALMKEFARRAAVRHRDADGLVAAEIADSRGDQSSDRLAQRDQVQHLMTRLDEREQAVLRAHFGLAGNRAGATYEEVGRSLGLSKANVRKIEQAALEKLRGADAKTEQ